jgi:hypothetical protein
MISVSKEKFVRDLMIGTTATKQESELLYDVLSNIQPTPEAREVVRKNIEDDAIIFDGGASVVEAVCAALYWLE